MIWILAWIGIRILYEVLQKRFLTYGENMASNHNMRIKGSKVMGWVQKNSKGVLPTFEIEGTHRYYGAYDPHRNTLIFSRDVWHEEDPYRTWIVLHEWGHFLQHRDAPFLKTWVTIAHNSFVGIRVLCILFLFAHVFTGFDSFMWIGFGYGVMVFLSLLYVFLPEINANKRAIYLINDYGMLDEEERKRVKRLSHLHTIHYLVDCFRFGRV
ncbi:zinc metallopeptidase (plasmid) [Pontibacillus sp. ALD_SL1]|uniref:zinc metallopeptidase n=1 Tax=Pontibacillus sp. ALD_SL1 TaxID=2777185 RepID=UPI001A967570|nr:zinc metallopeptidase [Pontibacillus sp. ALD_SL1]QST02782.1 zinc metallopeptidase [Pontibacillus sp. ALD_SL1]